jgi:hypothetical protein
MQSIEYEDDEHVTEDLVNTLLQTQQQLTDAHREIDRLRTELSASKSLLKSLQNELLLGPAYDQGLFTGAGAADEQQASKKKAKLSQDVLERWQFYRAHRSDNNILEPLKQKFVALGIDRVPWQVVKQVCDNMYRTDKGFSS